MTTTRETVAAIRAAQSAGFPLSEDDAAFIDGGSFYAETNDGCVAHDTLLQIRDDAAIWVAGQSCARCRVARAAVVGTWNGGEGARDVETFCEECSEALSEESPAADDWTVHTF